ncbi:Rmf/CrpP fold protein [Streptomyces anthocyanicus]|uniref:Rmf/CrpP fold protein n=1 Tax=Streptomyces anthocyanicus TaxID=68174 RepID=UPI003F4CB2BC
MGTRESIIRAMQEGAEAGRRGDPVTVCPYTDLRRTAWVRGYVTTAPPRASVEDDDA